MTDGPSGTPRKSWRERLGLRQPVPDRDEWVPVTAAPIDNAETGFSSDATQAAQALKDAGVEAQQRPFVLPDSTGFMGAAGGFSRGVTDRIQVAVLVHRRDFERAKEVLRPHDSEPEPVQDESE
jgi:hypothetical protein